MFHSKTFTKLPARAKAVTAIVALLTSGLSGCAASSSGACAAPEITVTPASSVAGEMLTIHGEHFFTGCADVIGVGSDGNSTKEEQSAMQGIDVSWSADDTQTPISSVDASVDGTWSLSWTVPESTPSGTLTLSAGTARATVTITR